LTEVVRMGRIILTGLESEPFSNTAVNAERPANCVAKHATGRAGEAFNCSGFSRRG
jgi:hypothetical protein